MTMTMTMIQSMRWIMITPMMAATLPPINGMKRPEELQTGGPDPMKGSDLLKKTIGVRNTFYYLEKRLNYTFVIGTNQLGFKTTLNEIQLGIKVLKFM